LWKKNVKLRRSFNVSPKSINNGTKIYFNAKPAEHVTKVKVTDERW